LEELKKDFNSYSGKSLTVKKIRDELEELEYKVTHRCLKGFSKIIEPDDYPEF
jgi:hypothetical protein